MELSDGGRRVREGVVWCDEGGRQWWVLTHCCLVFICRQSSLYVVFAGPVRWTGKKTEIGLNPTAKDRTNSCGCTNSEFFRLPVATFVKKSKN